MEGHLSPTALVRLFSGQMAGDEVDEAASHLFHCPPCGNLAAAVAARLQKNGRLVCPPEGGGAILAFLEVDERTALRCLLAHSRWADLKDLPTEEQIRRLQTVSELQTLEMFHTVMADAAAAQDDPFLGEERAHVAGSLAERLPARCCTEASRHDLQSRAMMAVADCRRMAGDRRGSSAALRTARGYLEKGTGDPVCKARYLSVQASLAADMGQLERARVCLARAGEIFRTMRDSEAVAATTIEEARAFLAAGRYPEALEKAEEALRGLTPLESRLESPARSLVTECLALLGRPNEALRNLLAAWPLDEPAGGRRTGLMLGDLVAYLLDVHGFAREAETAYRHTAAAAMEAERYKEAFLTRLTLLESLVRRGEWEEAVRACEDTLTLSERGEAGCHVQIVELWRDLLALVDARRLTEEQLLSARLFLVGHWNVPAQRALLLCEGAASSSGAALLPSWPMAEESEPQPTPEPPHASTGSVAVADFDDAMDRYESRLIAEGLAQCHGCILETSRLLDIAPNTLRKKMKKYGLDAGDDDPNARGEEKPELALDRLRAYGSWAELRRLPATQQIERIQDVLSLQTREMFDLVMTSASTLALEDPFRGEETALVAQALAVALPRSRCSERLRHDLLGEVLRVIGNCRRLTGDRPGSVAALGAAQGHLEQGTGDPVRQARLLSMQASLASEAGNLEEARALLARAAAISRRAQNSASVASIILKEAGTLLAAGRHEEAITQAEEVLRRITPREGRLEMLARSILTECLAVLRRPTEALRSLAATWPLYARFPGRRSEPQLVYLEALVLDAWGYFVEAEAAYRRSIEGYMEAELYKDAFLTMLTRFESRFRREAWAEAARACEEALILESRIGVGGHDQIVDLWRDLLALAESQRLTVDRVLEARYALVRHCSSPAFCTRSGNPPGFLRWDANGTPAPGASGQAIALPGGTAELLLAVEPPALPADLAGGGYWEALERYECRIIAAGLAHSGGKIKPAARLLGMSRTSLRDKARKYGLSSVA